MSTFSIKQIEGLVDIMTGDYRKLLAVIKSMEASIHIPSVRTYINLYYKKNGKKDEKMIEYYFKVKRKGVNNR